MGLSNLNPLRSRDAKRPKLPMYKQLNPTSSSSPTKERHSDVEDTSDDYSSDDSSDSSSRARPSPRRSRHASSSASSNSGLMAQRQSPTSQRRPPRRYFYRLPNKVIRVLCIALITTIVVFIFGLVRASQVENRRIAEGKVEKKPPPPPPWENFKFLTRYYGGLKTLVPVEENVPQYPRFEDEAPYNATAPFAQQEPNKSGKRDTAKGSSAATKAIPPSKSFMDHPGSVVPNSRQGFQECFLDEQKLIRIPPIQYYDGRPSGFPDNVIGSYELLSLPEDICFDRFGRYGPYGYGYSVKTGGLGVGEHGDRIGADEVWKSTKQVDWSSNIDWAEAQRRCFKANEGRYKPLEAHKNPLQGFYIQEQDGKSKLKTRADVQTSESTTTTKPAEEKEKGSATPEVPKPKGDIPRSALVIRAWDEIDWNAENILNIRALVAELSLASGGRYDVHLLVQVRNDGKNPVWADDEAYQKRINDTIPAEFRGMVTLWSETQMLAIYQGVRDLWTKGPELPVHGSYRGLQMAMQHFAYKHPEYEHFWQWEMDIRYTGHYYDLLSKLEAWAKEQPRKGLWERNARFYMPYVHGTWDDFKQMARVQTEHGTVGADNIWDNAIKKGGNKDKQESPNQVKTKGEKSIWGPERPKDSNDWFEHDQDPVPPTSYERDKYAWGVGEEADLITLNPIFNPEGTTWGLADDITGYNETNNNGKPPRRAQIITASRMSRRLLLTMHRETAFKKHHAFPEMWPATVALHHGYKAVFAPHPLFVDREWPTEYMAHILNGGRNGASGGSRMSVFGNREHNMRGLTWFYNAGFSANLYKRWLGLKVNNDGGEQFELRPNNSADDQTVSTMRGGDGRMCLPPMLLHPVKDVVLPVEQEAEEAKVTVPESDPSA